MTLFERSGKTLSEFCSANDRTAATRLCGDRVRATELTSPAPLRPGSTVERGA
jgi:hypothetical protein